MQTALALAQDGTMDIEQAALKIAHRLQTSLEVARIVELFSEELQPILAHEGISYRNEGAQVDLTFGRDAMHQCSYELNLQGEALGTATLWRKRPFTERETEQLEQLFVVLLYPLRHALMYQQAIAASLTDPITGVSNRAALDMLLDREVELARRHGSDLAVIMVDIDRFKQINDTHGHLAGDQVLRKVAAVIRDCVRSSDVVARFGGEEFLVLLRNTDLFGAALLAQRIRAAIERTVIRENDKDIIVTVSLGVTSLHDEESSRDLVSRADQALYQAKREGRNRVVEYAA